MGLEICPKKKFGVGKWRKLGGISSNTSQINRIKSIRRSEAKNRIETMNHMFISGRRSMSTVSKAVAEIVGVGKTKTRKATSELCTFMGIPHHCRSEIALIISKFIKLYNFRVPILHFFLLIYQHTPTV